jgi:hypothetical protein
MQKQFAMCHDFPTNCEKKNQNLTHRFEQVLVTTAHLPSLSEVISFLISPKER